MNDMNDKFVEELLASVVQLQCLGAANHEILSLLAQLKLRLQTEPPIPCPYCGALPIDQTT